MNELEIIGVFFCVLCITCCIWFILYMIIDGDDDEKIVCASVSVIIVFIILFTIVISEYVGDERKINEYEKMEIKDEAND